jgi:aldehyde dehydrogenase (NAD+)
MVSFTGSTRAGIEVAKAAAATVKRVAQELGGKSPNIVLDDAAFAKGVGRGVASMMLNSGQSCNAPSRMLVPNKRMDEAIAVAREAASQVTVGDPNGNAQLGPVVSKVQWDKIQGLIQKGIDEGATLVTGGVGRPEGLKEGYFVKPTVFGNVKNTMTIAREEIFGPVLSVIPFRSVDDGLAQGNTTNYGLAAAVWTRDVSKALRAARAIRAGTVWVNAYNLFDAALPFGGFKELGFGRELGSAGLDPYTEVKTVWVDLS